MALESHTVALGYKQRRKANPPSSYFLTQLSSTLFNTSDSRLKSYQYQKMFRNRSSDGSESRRGRSRTRRPHATAQGDDDYSAMEGAARRDLSVDNLTTADCQNAALGPKPNRVMEWVGSSTDEAPPAQNETVQPQYYDLPPSVAYANEPLPSQKQTVQYRHPGLPLSVGYPNDMFQVRFANIPDNAVGYNSQEPSDARPTFGQDNSAHPSHGRRQGETFSQHAKRVMTIFEPETGLTGVPDGTQFRPAVYDKMITAIRCAVEKAFTDQITACSLGNACSQHSLANRSFIQPVLRISVNLLNLPPPLMTATPSRATLGRSVHPYDQYFAPSQASETGSYAQPQSRQTHQSAFYPRVINGGSVVDRRTQQPFTMATGRHPAMSQYSHLPQMIAC